MFGSMLNLPGSVLGEFERMRRELDELFGASGMPASIRSVAPGSFPALNVGHTPDSVEIHAFAPGVDPAKVEVTLDRGVLTIAGERASTLPGDEDGKKVNVYSRERVSGPFRRTVSLPEDIDPAQVQATYRDGVLRVSIARRAAARPQRIAIQ